MKIDGHPSWLQNYAHRKLSQMWLQATISLWQMFLPASRAKLNRTLWLHKWTSSSAVAEKPRCRVDQFWVGGGVGEMTLCSKRCWCQTRSLTARFKSQNGGKLDFRCISLLLGPQPTVSILRITVCTISDNEGIPIRLNLPRMAIHTATGEASRVYSISNTNIRTYTV